MELSARERSMLDYERSWWIASRPKGDEIRARFELSTTSYYRLLGELVETDTAYDYDPLVVKRIRRDRRRRRGLTDHRPVIDRGQR